MSSLIPNNSPILEPANPNNFYLDFFISLASLYYLNTLEPFFDNIAMSELISFITLTGSNYFVYFILPSKKGGLKSWINICTLFYVSSSISISPL